MTKQITVFARKALKSEKSTCAAIRATAPRFNTVARKDLQAALETLKLNPARPAQGPIREGCDQGSMGAKRSQTQTWRARPVGIPPS